MRPPVNAGGGSAYGGGVPGELSSRVRARRGVRGWRGASRGAWGGRGRVRRTTRGRSRRTWRPPAGTMGWEGGRSERGVGRRRARGAKTRRVGRSCYARVRVGDRQPQIAGGEGRGSEGDEPAAATKAWVARADAHVPRAERSRAREGSTKREGRTVESAEDGRPARESSPIRQRTPTHAGVAAGCSGHPPSE